MRWIANLVMLLGKKIQTECITESISEREVSNFDVDLGDKAEDPFEISKIIASKKGDDHINEEHLQQALRKIVEISRPFRVNSFNRVDFDLQDELAKESRKKGPKNSNMSEKQNYRKSANK
ncbi:hypothetical protein [Paenibacillus amylolyticus]|uniref:hypothetical protein n=1 Tax=Paenibacillus amylolyticus TaxID=1451 RepID=UPI003397C73C